MATIREYLTAQKAAIATNIVVDFNGSSIHIKALTYGQVCAIQAQYQTELTQDDYNMKVLLAACFDENDTALFASVDEIYALPSSLVTQLLNAVRNVSNGSV